MRNVENVEEECVALVCASCFQIPECVTSSILIRNTTIVELIDFQVQLSSNEKSYQVFLNISETTLNEMKNVITDSAMQKLFIRKTP